MSSSDESEIEDLIKKIHRVHIQRHKIYKREQQLIKRLVDARKRQASAERRPRRRREEEAHIPRTASRGVKTDPSEHRKLDRFGNELKVGDTVEFLKVGRLPGKLWTIYKITEKRVLCERNNGAFTTHREFHNVKKVD